MSILSDIGGGIKSLFHGVENGLDTAVKSIASVPQHAETIVDNAVQTGGKIVNKVVDEGSSIIHTAEYTLILPLAAIGIGLAIMMSRSNPNTIQSIGTAGINKI